MFFLVRWLPKEFYKKSFALKSVRANSQTYGTYGQSFFLQFILFEQTVSTLLKV